MIVLILGRELLSGGSFHYHWTVNTRSRVLSPKEEVGYSHASAGASLQASLSLWGLDSVTVMCWLASE